MAAGHLDHNAVANSGASAGIAVDPSAGAHATAALGAITVDPGSHHEVGVIDPSAPMAHQPHSDPSAVASAGHSAPSVVSTHHMAAAPAGHQDMGAAHHDAAAVTHH